MSAETILLRLLSTRGVGPSRARAIVDAASREGVELFEVDTSREILSRFLSDPQLEAFTGDDSATDWVEQISRLGGRLLAITHPDYPESLRLRLGKKAPLLLTVIGNPELLNLPAVGFCGSRKASDKGIAVARDCAPQLAEKGVCVVSGNATGVDLAAHRSALEVDGTTVLVLAEGALKFRVKRALKDVWSDERTAIISEFLPNLPWKAHNAMQRNNTICALSRAMILIEAGTTGGSIEAGRSALRLGVPLFAAEYGGMPESAAGNREIVSEGANTLRKSRSTGRANLSEVWSALEEAPAKGEEDSPTLFGS